VVTLVVTLTAVTLTGAVIPPTLSVDSGPWWQCFR